MIKPSDRKIPFVLSILTAVLTIVVAGYGMLNPSLYTPMTPDHLLPGTVSQDLISLFAAIGLLLCVAAVRRGQEMAWLIWVGLLGYLFYAYAIYCFEGVYNTLYLFYVAILGMTVYGLITFFYYADLGAIHLKPDHKPPPRRATAMLLLLLVFMFIVLWLSILLPAMSERATPEAGTIFVLDLAFFLPLLVIEATFLWRKKALGDALAIPLLIKIGTLGISVLLGTLFGPLFDQTVDWPSVAIYALLGIGPLLFVVPFMRSVGVYR